MLNKIAQVIVSHMDKECKHWNIEKMDNLSQNLLDKLEALGMKPPERVFWNRNPNGALMPHMKNGEMVNSWENE